VLSNAHWEQEVQGRVFGAGADPVWVITSFSSTPGPPNLPLSRPAHVPVSTTGLRPRRIRLCTPPLPRRERPAAPASKSNPNTAPDAGVLEDTVREGAP
jgi:hypothetical protein